MLALTFQIDGSRVALDVRRISRVVPHVPLTRPAGSPPWLAGVFVYAQTVVPVVDVHRLLGSGECPVQLSSRIILVPWPPIAGRKGGSACWRPTSRKFAISRRPLSSAPSASAQPMLGPTVVEQGAMIRLLDLEHLLPPAVRDQLAGVCAA